MNLTLKKPDYHIFDEYNHLLDYSPIRKFNRQTEIIYKGHIPIAAYLLIQGQMFFKERNQEMNLLPGALVGIKEILHNIPFKYDVVVTAGSELIILDKSTIYELCRQGHLKNIVDEFEV